MVTNPSDQQKPSVGTESVFIIYKIVAAPALPFTASVLRYTRSLQRNSEAGVT